MNRIKSEGVIDTSESIEEVNAGWKAVFEDRDEIKEIRMSNEISISKLERSIIQKLIAMENNQRYFEKDKSIAKEDTFIDMSIGDFGLWLSGSFRRGFDKEYRDNTETVTTEFYDSNGKYLKTERREREGNHVKIDYYSTIWTRKGLGVRIESKYNGFHVDFEQNECEFATWVWDNHNTRGVNLDEMLDRYDIQYIISIKGD